MADVLDVIEHILKIYEKSLEKPSRRRSFSKMTKRMVLAGQKNRCNKCGNKLDAVDFDHIDGNSLNNSLDNCQALCPNCHAKKTRKNKARKLRLSQIFRKFRI